MPEFLTGSSGMLLLTLASFLVVLTFIVFIHEFGHYLVGRWCGIGVEEFAVGFGPELFGFNDRRGTRWKISAIPLGGFVKFVGDMTPAGEPDAQALNKLSPEQRRVAFHTQPLWKRVLTVAAGPIFNFLLAIAIFAVFLMLYGKAVSDPMVAQVTPDSPAAAAGFQPGDRFVSIDGSPVHEFSDVQRAVFGRAGDTMEFVVRRGDADVTLHAAPREEEIDDGLGNKVKIGVIGIRNDAELGKPRVEQFGPVAAVREAAAQTGAIIAATGRFLQRLVMGREDRCKLNGIAKMAKTTGQAAALGPEVLVQWAALISVGIGFMNLLPIPPLDGGHLALYAIEAVMRRPVSARAAEMVFRIGFVAVLAFMVFAFTNDIHCW